MAADLTRAFLFSIVATAAAVAPASAALADAMPGSFRLSTDRQSVSEGAGSVTVTVQRVGGAAGAVSVYFDTIDMNGVATAGVDDYEQGHAGVLQWADGDGSAKTVAIGITDDTQLEGDERFVFRIGTPTGGATMGSPVEQRITIVDNDAVRQAGTLRLLTGQQSVSEGAGAVTVMVERVGGTDGAASVYYDTFDMNGVATAGLDDYEQGHAGVLQWADGQGGAKSVVIGITNDATVEGDEQFVFRIGTPTGAALGTPTEERVVIVDDDGLPDVDGDGVKDTFDNCRTAANTSQIDLDRDGIGDACDPTPGCPPVGTSTVAEWDSHVDAGFGSGTSAVPFEIPAACGVQLASVQVMWKNRVEDLDLTVTGPSGAGARSYLSQRTNLLDGPSEEVTIDDPAGSFTAEVLGYLSAGTNYHGKITLTVGEPTACQKAFPVTAPEAASVSSGMPFGQSTTLILSFAHANGREAAMKYLASAALLGGAEKSGLHPFNHLPMITFPVSSVSTRLIQNLKVQLAPFGLVSIWHNSRLPLLLDQSTAYIQAPAAAADYGVTGKGIGVAIIDSGVDGTQGDFAHLAYNAKVIEGLAAIETPDSDTSSGHGTHVAGIVGGTGAMSGGKFHGVAPEATLVGFGTGDGDSIILTNALYAYDQLIDPAFRARYNVRVTNNSYGGDPAAFDPTDPIAIAVKEAYDVGIVSVFAAGNAGPGASTMAPTSKSPCAIAVANGNTRGLLAGSSSRGANPAGDPNDVPDITAPGTFITSTRSANGAITPPNRDYPRYATISGTSMASPHVAGVVALLLQARPNLKFEQVLQLLQDTATPMTDEHGTPYKTFEVGAGYVNVHAAVQKALGGLGARDPVHVETLTAGQSLDWHGYTGATVAPNGTLIACLGCDSTGEKFPFILPAVAGGYSNLTVRLEYATPAEKLRLQVTGPAGANKVSSNSVASFQEVAFANPKPGRWIPVFFEETSATTPYRMIVTATCNIAGCPTGAPDQDADGIPDASDNCVATPNPSQSDLDGDGIGDACDVPETTCAVPGITLTRDPDGDDAPPLPTADNGAGDILSLQVSEPADRFGKLIFTLKMRSLASLPPNMEWFVIFNGPPKGTNVTGKWHVDMSTDETSTPTFSYGRYSTANQGLSQGPSTADGDEPAAVAVAGSHYDAATGTITLVVDKSNFAVPGQVLRNITPVVYQLVGAAGSGSLQVVDSAGSGSYTLRTLDACTLPPDADGDGVPDSGDACPATPSGAAVDAAGCAATQRDSDQDGVSDAVDECPDTAAGESANAQGCAASQYSQGYGDGLLGAIAQFMSELNTALAAVFDGDLAGAASAVQVALANLVDNLSGLPEHADDPVQLVGLDEGIPETVARSTSANRAVEAVVLTGAQLPGWSQPAAAGIAQNHFAGFENFTGATQPGHGPRNAHAGIFLYPANWQPGDAPVNQGGADIGKIAAYAYKNGAWQEIRVQVDERYPFFLANGNSTFSFYSGIDTELTYAWDTESWGMTKNDPANACNKGYDPNGIDVDRPGTNGLYAPLVPGADPNQGVSKPVPDPVAGLDNDDEIAFMAQDAGDLYSSTSYPAGWQAVQMVKLNDPLEPGAARYVYLVQKDGGSSFSAEDGYVSYRRNADADRWIDRASFADGDPEQLGSSNTNYGPNLSGSVCAGGAAGTHNSTDRFPKDGVVVSTGTYRWEASGRWMIRDLRIRQADASAVDATYWQSRPDLIDRWKGRAFQQSPDSSVSVVGFEDEQVNWEANSSLLGERCGAVRCMREVWGADSGTNVTKQETFYRDAISYHYHVRVHPIPPDGLYTSWDYNRSAMLPAANESLPAGRYFTQLRPQGVPIDGVNDDVGQADSFGGQPAFFDAADPTFNLTTGFYNWEQVSGKGDYGSLVYLFEMKGATSAGNPLVVPFYRDDACMDDGTGDDPVQRPWPGEISTDSRVTAGYSTANGGTPYASLRCDQKQGDFGAHGVHYFFTHDTDNATMPAPVTEVDGQQWQFMVPTDRPHNVAEPYANVVRAPLQATAVPIPLLANLVGAGGSEAPEETSACAVPGARLLTDASGDYDVSGAELAPGAVPDANQDLQAAYIAQPYVASGGLKLEFRLKVASLQQLQPNSAYFLSFKAPDGVLRGVRMEVDGTLAATYYTYVVGESSGHVTDGRFVDTQAATPGSYDAQTGMITFTVDPSAIAVDPAAPGAAARTLKDFNAGVTQSAANFTFVPDMMPDTLARTGSRTVQPNFFCSTDPNADSDGDGTIDTLDNCPGVPNAGQANHDTDGLGDACDADDDNDGVADGSDAFPFDPAESADADKDGIGDVADLDDDNDGTADLLDNCPRVANPGQADTDGDGEGDACDAAAARVVVAVLDTGINPYHEYLYAGSEIYPNSAPTSVTPEILAQFGIDAAHTIDLVRTGNFTADYQRDKAAIWDQIRPRELYWFKGTNVIAVSYDECVDDPTTTGDDCAAAPPRRPILPDPGDTSGEHGVGTSAAVLTANPDAIVLFVEFGGANVGYAPAEDFGFNHPLVDVITTSYGAAVPLVGVGLPIPFTSSFGAVVEKGKLFFSSAANSPDPTTPEAGGAGPWWIMGVAGMEEGSSEGKTSVSGFFPDFVSDFTQTLPYCFECESGLSSTVAGTSFATPRSAGVASRVLLEARRRLHDSGSIREVLGKPVLASDGTRTISNWQVRRALEEAAYVETLDQYDPINAIFDLGALPPVDEAPWLTVGWGDLSAKSEKGVVQEALAQLGFGTPTRHKTGGFCEYQTAIYKRRWVYWNNPAMAAFNGYTPPAHDPYIYCESALAPVNELPVVGSSPEPAAQDPDTLSCPAAGSETQLASYAGTAPTGLPFVRTSTQTYKVEVSGCTFTKLRFELRWDNANYDLDMKVTGPGYDSGAEAASSADPEVTSKTNPSSGTYTIAVSSYLNVDTPYTVKVFGTR